MRVPPAQPAASRCRRSCERHGSGSRSASPTPVMRVWKMKQCTSASSRAQRAREAQVEEAVQAHRAADVEQQHEARAHAAAILPGEPERRAAARDAAPDRALQVETAAVVEARFAAQLQVLQASRETAHQRLDVARLLGAIRGRGNRSTRAIPRGSRHAAAPAVVVFAVPPPWPRRAAAGCASPGAHRPIARHSGRDARSPRTPSCSAAGSRRRTARRSAAIRRRGRTAAP